MLTERLGTYENKKKKENDMSDEVRDSLLVDNLNVSDLLYFQHERYFQDANLQKAYLWGLVADKQKILDFRIWWRTLF